MDFLDFEAQSLYFDTPLTEEVDALINQAAEKYGDAEAEFLLRKAYSKAPDHLTVHVALYRFFFYQHRLHDAIAIANKTLEVSAKELDFPDDWRLLTMEDLGVGAIKSMGLVRYYFLALKAAGYLHIRVGNRDLGIAMLKKVAELDTSERLGAAAVLEVVMASSAENIAANG